MFRHFSLETLLESWHRWKNTDGGMVEGENVLSG